MAWKSVADRVFVDPGPALKRFIETVQKHPVEATVAGGMLVAAKNTMKPHAVEQEKEFMRNRLGSPDGKFVYASEKVASMLEEMFVKEAANPSPSDPTSWNTAWSSGVEGLGKSVGEGIGGTGVLLLSDILRKAGRGLAQKLVYDSKRREMLRTALTTDPMLRSFEAQNPGLLLKVYASMVSVAPTLSLDKNATLTFLREAAQTHGALNYITIKQLAETEKAINEAKGTDLNRLRL
jgi:hypothetical protein